jgi:hypothetical protein
LVTLNNKIEIHGGLIEKNIISFEYLFLENEKTVKNIIKKLQEGYHDIIYGTEKFNNPNNMVKRIFDKALTADYIYMVVVKYEDDVFGETIRNKIMSMLEGIKDLYLGQHVEYTDKFDVIQYVVDTRKPFIQFESLHDVAKYMENKLDNNIPCVFTRVYKYNGNYNRVLNSALLQLE